MFQIVIFLTCVGITLYQGYFATQKYIEQPISTEHSEAKLRGEHFSHAEKPELFCIPNFTK